MHEPHPHLAPPSRRATLGGLLSATRQLTPAVAARTWPLALLAGLLGAGSGDTEDFELTASSAVVFGVGALVMCALLFGLYVWMIRRAAPALAIAPLPPLSVGRALGAGIVAGAFVLGGLVLLVIPGLIAIVLLQLMLPLVAFEAMRGLEAASESVALVRANAGTFTGLAVLTFVVYLVLDPYTWSSDPFGLPSVVAIAVQVAINAAITVASITAYALAWRELRAVVQVPAAAAPSDPIHPRETQLTY